MSTKKFLISIIIIGICILIINTFLLQICIVRGKSMEPTLHDKNLIIIKKYKMEIKRDDIAVIKKDKKIIIKRVVGIPGDKLQIKEGYLYVNEQKYDDYYMEYAGLLQEGVCLNKDEYFVIGDNRNYSIDSRFNEIGFIKKNEIIGKVLFK